MLFYVTKANLDTEYYQKRLNRKNLEKYKKGADEIVRLKDEYYLLVINTGEETIQFTVSDVPRPNEEPKEPDEKPSEPEDGDKDEGDGDKDADGDKSKDDNDKDDGQDQKGDGDT